MNKEDQNYETSQKKDKKKNGEGTKILLHILQHTCFIWAVVAAAMVLLGSLVVIDGRKGTSTYRLKTEKQGTLFEDSEMFNQLLGNSAADIICYGAIRAQLETDGKFDPKKQIDVTAFADRYEGTSKEYITAVYYLDDLIKWKQNGLEYEDVYMTGIEADQFLSRTRTVTKVDVKEGGNTSYLNSDLESVTTVVDVSGNILVDYNNPIREDVLATILKNRYHTVEGKNIEDYVSSWGEYYELRDNVQKAAEDIGINYKEYLSYKDYYDGDNSNVVYYIRKTINGKTEVLSNGKAGSLKLSDLKKQLKEECGKYIIYDPKNMEYETNTLIEESTLRYILNGYAYAYPEDTQILIGVKSPYAAKDAFTQARTGYNQYSPYFWQYMIMAVVGSLLYFLFLILLTRKEGKAVLKGTEETVIALNPGDKIPTEAMLLLNVGVMAVIAFAIKSFVDFVGERTVIYSGKMPVTVGVAAVIVSFAISFFYYSYVRRIKAGTIWKNSLLRRLSSSIIKGGIYLYDHGSVILRVLVPYGILIMINMMGLLSKFIFNLHNEQLVIIVILILAVDGVIGFLLYKSALGRQNILDGIKQINAGHTEYKIDEMMLHGDNLILAREVNGIGEGIRNAVEASMKNERLKADLITNVSHDIKTPLTSIINYVDLIKREDVDNAKVQEYIEVLDAKSQRLKQLTDDLVEASKISSGNIILQFEKINLVELCNQTIGEFSEKFKEKNLIPVMRTQESCIYIEADSRRIWRVIENLFNNIFKYALEGTRVYIDLEEKELEKGKRQVALSVKNISANPIKGNSDELTERFIRGDESRTTEGSGLGLSIAKNLTEAMRGSFEIVVDGDLFKVIMTFPMLEWK
ncbi:MAG: HAMP domain-containing histidine kinase [Lachnospiraceae bacterium]|nr:HAMP domain-containing histidine kinase [Lachnospiraceae bacterium]